MFMNVYKCMPEWGNVWAHGSVSVVTLVRKHMYGRRVYALGTSVSAHMTACL